MLTPELDVLRPIDPSVAKNEDDYEIYILSNAQVFHARNGKHASLLTAYADTPLRVEGRLEAPDRSKSRYCASLPALSRRRSDEVIFENGGTLC